MFEVEDLKYATLATVSRCGMVWFSEEVVQVRAFEFIFSRQKDLKVKWFVYRWR